MPFINNMKGKLKIISSNNKVFKEGEVFSNADWSGNTLKIYKCDRCESCEEYRITGTNIGIWGNTISVRGHIETKGRRSWDPKTYWRTVTAELTVDT